MPEISRADIAAASEGSEGAEGSQQQQQAPSLAEKAAEGGSKLPQQEQQPEIQGATPQAEEYVYPDDDSIPEQLRGKRASEAAGLFNTLFTTSRQMAQYLQNSGGQQQQQQQEPAKPTFEQDDFITGEPAKIEEKLGMFFNAKAQPFVVDIYKNLTMQTMQTARQALPHYAKYEQEILGELANLPINQTANFQTWKDAHDRVTARHIDEIAAARSRTKEPAPFTERGGGQAPAGAQPTELTADQMKIADGLGVPYDQFKRFATMYANNNQGI